MPEDETVGGEEVSDRTWENPTQLKRQKSGNKKVPYDDFKEGTKLRGYSRFLLTNERRKIIKEIMYERGIVSPTKIQKILKEEYNTVINKNAVYRDIREIGGVNEVDMALEDTNLISLYKRMRKKLEKIIEEDPDVRVRMTAMRSLSQLAKDQHTIETNIAMRGNEMPKKEKKKKGEEIFIRFGDQEASVPIVEETTDEKD